MIGPKFKIPLITIRKMELLLEEFYECPMEHLPYTLNLLDISLTKIFRTVLLPSLTKLFLILLRLQKSQPL